MGEGEEDGGCGAVVEAGELVGEGEEEGVFVVDLVGNGEVSFFVRRWVLEGEGKGGGFTITLVFTSTVTMASL